MVKKRLQQVHHHNTSCWPQMKPACSRLSCGFSVAYDRFPFWPDLSMITPYTGLAPTLRGPPCTAVPPATSRTPDDCPWHHLSPRRHAEYVVGFPRWVTVWGLPSSVGDAVRLAVGAINVGLLAWLAFAPHTESRVAACAVSFLSIFRGVSNVLKYLYLK